MQAAALSNIGGTTIQSSGGESAPEPVLKGEQSHVLAIETASVQRLIWFLERVPNIWVGAGMSIPAGYPSTELLVQEMRKNLTELECTSNSFDEVADAYYERYGKNEMASFLLREIGISGQPTLAHEALAQLTHGGKVHDFFTTNYDDLIERSLRNAGVLTVVQVRGLNERLTPHGAKRVFKVHGSGEDWANAVITKRSYQEFDNSDEWMKEQLDRMFEKEEIIFLGCSFKDPRLLRWLSHASEEKLRSLKPWCCLMAKKSWQELTTYRWGERRVEDVLASTNLTILQLESHHELPALLAGASNQLTPSTKRRGMLEDQWRIVTERRTQAEIIIRRDAKCVEWTEDLHLSGHISSLSSKKKTLPEVELEPSGELRYKVTIPAEMVLCLAGRVGPSVAGVLAVPNTPRTTNVFQFDLHAGRYYFRCSIHKKELNGWLWGRRFHYSYKLDFETFLPWKEMLEAGDYPPDLLNKIESNFQSQLPRTETR